MPHSKRLIIKSMSFLLIFAVILFLLDYFLNYPDSADTQIMKDFYKADDPQLIALGNSHCTMHVNPHIIEDELGMSAFTLGIKSAQIEAVAAMARETFRTKSPKQVVLVYDPFLQITPDERFSVYAKLAHHIRSPITRLKYLGSLLKDNLTDLNRLFPWRFYFNDKAEKITSLSRLKEYIQMADDPELKREHDSDLWNLIYDGKGFYKLNGEPHAEEIISAGRVKVSAEYEDIPAGVAEQLLEIKRLCDSNNCRLIVVSIPHIRNVVLSDERYMNAFAAIDAFCSANAVPCYHFTYAKPELLPYEEISRYFFEEESHLNGDGADIFTRALCKVLEPEMNGQSAADLFYTREEWLASIDRIIDAWYTCTHENDSIVYTGFSTHGTPVSPEYRFIACGADGSEEILRDWSSSGEMTVAETALGGRTVRMEARDSLKPEGEPVIYCGE